jgi:hypothetical protein
LDAGAHGVHESRLTLAIGLLERRTALDQQLRARLSS